MFQWGLAFTVHPGSVFRCGGGEGMPSDHIGTIDALVVANHERIRGFVVPIMNVF